MKSKAAFMLNEIAEELNVLVVSFRLASTEKGVLELHYQRGANFPDLVLNGKPQNKPELADKVASVILIAKANNYKDLIQA